MTYFIHDEASGAVKIGIADDVPRRLSALQIGNPNPLTLVGTIPGGPREESKLHRQFATHHRRGEWFSSTPGIMAAIRDLIHRFAETDATYEEHDTIFSISWCRKAVTSGTQWEAMQELVRLRVMRLTGLGASVAWLRIGDPISRVSVEFRYQIMPDPEHESHPFWGWYLDSARQYHETPGAAAVMFVEAYRWWMENLSDRKPILD